MYQLASPGELGSFYNNNNKVVRSTSSDSITTTSSSTDDANTASIGNSNSNAHSSGFGGLFRRYRSRNPAARSVESNNNNNNHNHEASSSSNFFDRGDDELHGYLKLKKKGSFGTTWKKFYFRLSTSMDIVSWYASELDLNVIDEVNLTNAHVMRAEGMTNKPYSFGIFVPNSSPLFLQADSQQQMEQWITSIEARTKKNSDSSTNSSVLRKAMDAMLEACVASNEHGIIVAWNKAAEQLFGWTAEEAIGKNVSILMPSPYSDTHDALLMNYRRTGNKRLIGKPRKLFGLRKDGSTFNIELSLGEVESQLNHAHSQVTEEEKAKQPRWIAIFRDLSVHHNNNNNNSSNNVKTDQTSWSSCEESVKRDSLRLEIPLDVNTTTTTTNDGLHHGLHSFHDGSFSSTGCPVMHSINLTSNGITSAPHPLPHAYHYGNDGNHNNRSRPGSDDHLESLNYARGFLNQLLHQHMDQFAGTMGVVIEELYEKLEEMHQQVEIMSTENHRLMDCLVAKTREVEDLQAELQEWKKGDVSNFEKLLKDDDAFAAYLEFATKESNQENLLFWREAERFKSIVFIKDLQEKAMEIYETYVREGAPRCLNTTKAMRDQVLSHLKDPSRELFTPLQTTVLKNMRMDSFARFQQTPKGKAIAAKFMTEKD